MGTVSSHTLAGASTICLCGGSHYLLLPHQLTNGRLEAAVKWPVTNSTLGTEERPWRDEAWLPYRLDGSSHATQKAGKPSDRQDAWRPSTLPTSNEHRKSPETPWSPWAAAPPACLSVLEHAPVCSWEGKWVCRGSPKQGHWALRKRHIRPVGVAGQGWGRTEGRVTLSDPPLPPSMSRMNEHPPSPFMALVPL